MKELKEKNQVLTAAGQSLIVGLLPSLASLPALHFAESFHIVHIEIAVSFSIYLKDGMCERTLNRLPRHSGVQGQ
jgi:hypothetical protein